VGRNDQYWFSSSNSQRDSGLAYPTDLNGGRQMQIPDFGSPNGGLARAALDDSRRDVPNYSGPPYSQSLPPISSPQLQTSVANAGNWPQRTAAADSFPSTVTSQTVTKQPMDMSVRSTIAADSSATRTDKRTLVYMFMLLLCSIGLNIYLGWISRGFYVRYHELAEELRETFTPSGAN
jgi:hypothetical protein